MKINYTSSITGTRTTARVDENLWSILQASMALTGCKKDDPRTELETWLTALDKEYRTFAGNEAATFSAYISKRFTEEVLMDLTALDTKQERLNFA